MKNWLLRTATGLVYIAFIVCGVMLQSPAMWIMIFLLALGATSEFHRLAAKLGAAENPMILFYDTLGVLIAALLPSAAGSVSALSSMALFIVLYLVSRPVISLYVHDMKVSLRGLAFAMLGLLYIGLPLAMMGWIGLMGNGHGRWILLGMFILIWVNDTGAFVIGSMMGSKKLFERLSPKKSWEGFIGGLVFAVIGGVVYYYCAHAHLPATVSVVEMGIYGALVSIASTWGDLFESMLKRAAGVKDSGNMLPGHGGVLDRIDSLLLVLPVTFVFMSVAIAF